MIAPRRRLIIMCNALDDGTRLARGITTDSPAASRKVFMMARAIATAGINPVVLSMGRGRGNASGRFHKAKVLRVNGVLTVYLPFNTTPLLSEIISLLAPVPILWRLHRHPIRTTMVFYNQLVAYLPALLMSRLLGHRAVLDLEDGATTSSSIGRRIGDLIRCVPFEWLCDRALLACSALAGHTRLRPTYCYYGVQETVPSRRDWARPVLHVLLGGSIDPETGADMVADAIVRLRQEQPDWARAITFDVTGKGASLPRFSHLAATYGTPAVTVHGRTTDIQYGKILGDAHIGLALKPNEGPLAHTTFPSKVIEMAGTGLLVVSTDISDVRAILGNDARYVVRDEVELLLGQLSAIVEDRAAAADLAEGGAARIARICAPEVVGQNLADFFFEGAE